MGSDNSLAGAASATATASGSLTTPVYISKFATRVRPDVKLCPTSVLTTYLRDTIIDFCERSRSWRDFMTALNSVAAEPNYTVVPPDGTVIVEVIEVKMNGLIVNPQTREWLNLNWFGWDTCTGSQPEYWIADARDQITLVATPSDDGVLNIVPRAIIKPNQDTLTVPQFLYDHYLEPIAAGAKARLMMISDKPWTNPQLAEVNEQKYEDGVSRAKSIAEKGYNRTRQRAQASFF